MEYYPSGKLCPMAHNDNTLDELYRSETACLAFAALCWARLFRFKLLFRTVGLDGKALRLTVLFRVRTNPCAATLDAPLSIFLHVVKGFVVSTLLVAIAPAKALLAAA